MKQLINKIKSFIGWPEYSHKVIEDQPNKLAPKTIYVIDEKKEPIKLVFMCPCGCGDPIEIGMIQGLESKWKIKYDFLNRVSIYPSIWRKNKCKSHFFIRRGKIIWCHQLT